MIRAAFLLDRRRRASGTPAATARAIRRTTGRWGHPFAPTCGLVSPTETVRGSPCRPCDAFSVRAMSAMIASGSGGSASARTSMRLCDAIAAANCAAARCSRCGAPLLCASGAAAPTVAATSMAVRLATGAAVCAAVADGAADVDSVPDEAADVTAAGTELATASTPGAARFGAWRLLPASVWLLLLDYPRYLLVPQLRACMNVRFGGSAQLSRPPQDYGCSPVRGGIGRSESPEWFSCCCHT